MCMYVLIIDLLNKCQCAFPDNRWGIFLIGHGGKEVFVSMISPLHTTDTVQYVFVCVSIQMHVCVRLCITGLSFPVKRLHSHSLIAWLNNEQCVRQMSTDVDPTQ